DAASGAVEIEWKEIDLGRVMEAAAGSNLPVLPSAAAAGSLTAAWTAPRLDAFRVRSESRLAPLGANAAAAGNRRPMRGRLPLEGPDRKSTRLNSSHVSI